MFISEAMAQQGAGGGFLIQFAPLVLIFAVFYFLLIRPQQKKNKRSREMGDVAKGIENIKIGMKEEENSAKVDEDDVVSAKKETASNKDSKPS